MDDDKISEFPDDVLCHILSFLPTLDAMDTSVLSSRWKYLWRNMSKLSFDDALPPSSCRPLNAEFAYFVNRALILHNPRSALEEFNLKCFKNYKPYDVSSWISHAIMKGIKSLNLQVNDGSPLPTNFFNCGTLEVLRLHGHVYINVPTVCSIPNLKTMKLKKVRFQDIQSFRRLITSAASLESFNFKGDLHLGIFIIHSSTLRELKFVTSGCDNLNEFKLEIDCPALRSLKVDNYVSNKNLLISSEFLASGTLESLMLGGDIVFYSARIICLSSLKNLELFELNFYDNSETINRLISSCPSLKSLDIFMSESQIELKISSSTLEDLQIGLTSFTNLTHKSHKLVVDAPALQYLDLSLGGHGSIVDCNMEKLSSLKQAYIDIDPDVGNYHSFDYSNIYQALENVENLTIRSGTCKVLNFEHGLPMFRKLRVLEVTCGFDILHEFIKKSIMLQDLKFTVSSSRLDAHEIHWKNPKSVPTCLSSSLRRMSIHDFKGSDDELEMTEYVLENARIMQTMKIHFDSVLGSEVKAGLRNKLLNCHRVQEKCEVITK